MDDPVTRVRNLGQLWNDLTDNQKNRALYLVNSFRRWTYSEQITMADLPFVSWDELIASNGQNLHRKIHNYFITTYEIREKRGLIDKRFRYGGAVADD